MSHILGRREFWSLDFAVTPDVLTPRPDSETLVAAVLDCISDREQAVVPSAILHRQRLLVVCLCCPNCRTREALASMRARRRWKWRSATRRALRLAPRADFPARKLAAELDARFDVVVSNPPYIATNDLAGLAAEVQREPVLALDGGADGLDTYRLSGRSLRRVTNDWRLGRSGDWRRSGGRRRGYLGACGT